MQKRWDGSRQSTNTPSFNREGLVRDDYAMYRCMVLEVLYVDHPLNITKNGQNPEVLYTCVILGGAPAGNLISNCRLASWLGGDNSYAERNLTPSSKDPSKVKLSQHDGDIVYVEMNQGHTGYPTIIGLGKGVNNKIAAKAAEGPRWIEQFNGVQKNINNKGELITRMKTGTSKNGRFTANADDLIKQEWLLTEQDIETFKSGLKITKDGKNDIVTVQTKGGAVVTVDGKNDVITLKDKGTGKVKISGNKIAIGAAPAELLEQISQALQETITFANTESNHVHIGNLGYETSNPTTASNWLALGSALSAIKGLIDQIKGTL